MPAAMAPRKGKWTLCSSRRSSFRLARPSSFGASHRYPPPPALHPHPTSRPSFIPSFTHPVFPGTASSDASIGVSSSVAAWSAATASLPAAAVGSRRRLPPLAAVWREEDGEKDAPRALECTNCRQSGHFSFIIGLVVGRGCMHARWEGIQKRTCRVVAALAEYMI